MDSYPGRSDDPPESPLSLDVSAGSLGLLLVALGRSDSGRHTGGGHGGECGHGLTTDGLDVGVPDGLGVVLSDGLGVGVSDGDGVGVSDGLGVGVSDGDGDVDGVGSGDGVSLDTLGSGVGELGGDGVDTRSLYHRGKPPKWAFTQAGNNMRIQFTFA
ncbi:hypothetical protein [Nonomuraea turkmeniaca]|uniref:hypothetical protein n=1 Tax=Nonomuraea turkmeniaca TaxID=103838 RepID=UPI001476B169|nr:hypothetical protein [Nonomuraea turkmeniaca]